MHFILNRDPRCAIVAAHSANGLHFCDFIDTFSEGENNKCGSAQPITFHQPSCQPIRTVRGGATSLILLFFLRVCVHV